MKRDLQHQGLIDLFTALKEQEVLTEVRRLLEEQEPPLGILESCQKALRHVGEHYEVGRYYLSGLMMAGEIMRQVAEMLQVVIEQRICKEIYGRLVLGTVQGDIHDIGKNLVGVILRCHGFEVIDLGVDVTPDAFLKAVLEFDPDIVGMSGLLTVSCDAMKETVALLRENAPKNRLATPIIIGGGVVDEQIRGFVGSVLWAPDALTGAKMCQRLVTSSERILPQVKRVSRM
jgi:methylmalonyl-CoA mutase cobalamin-binding domain/chain